MSKCVCKLESWCKSIVPALGCFLSYFRENCSTRPEASIPWLSLSLSLSLLSAPRGMRWQGKRRRRAETVSRFEAGPARPDSIHCSGTRDLWVGHWDSVPNTTHIQLAVKWVGPRCVVPIKELSTQRHTGQTNLHREVVKHPISRVWDVPSLHSVNRQYHDRHNVFFSSSFNQRMLPRMRPKKAWPWRLFILGCSSYQMKGHMLDVFGVTKWKTTTVQCG